jgi:GNAT superfamily N-acetyltransferase
MFRENLPVPPNPLPRSASRTEAALRLIPFSRHRHRLSRVEIRPAREDEIEPLTRLFVRSRNEMEYLPRVPEEHIAAIADRIREHEEIWVAEEDGRMLGFIGIEQSRNLDAPVLERIYVEPREQNRGVGTALLDKAKELRPQGLYLWVFQKNEGARRLYERHGFELVELTDGAHNMEREPDALYRWKGSR